jgi:hypothetical protein
MKRIRFLPRTTERPVDESSGLVQGGAPSRRKCVVRGLVAAAGLLLFSVQPIWANTCPELISEGHNLLPKAKLAKAQENKVKTLLDEAQKLHDAGQHDASEKKANEALNLLKKK